MIIFLKSLELQDLEKDAHMRAQTLSNISRSYNFLGNYTKALNYAQQGLQLMETLEDKSGISYALDELGRAYIGLGKLAKGRPCFETEFYHQTGNR